VPRGTQVSNPFISFFVYGTVTLFRLPFQCSLTKGPEAFGWILQPRGNLYSGLGFSAFARHY
jgi:hypothetical protein